MYFLNLPNFHPNRGINTDNYHKAVFLSSVDGLFERDQSVFNYGGMLFPFKEIFLREEHFFVSEINLQKLFDPYNLDQLLRENSFPVNPELVEEIKAQFFKGYTDGLQNFDREIGSFFFSLAPAEQLKVLVDFMNYCHHHLYFEGFVIPEVLYSLGYIQACLVQSYKTYQNLSKLSVKEITGEPLIEASPVAEPPVLTLQNTVVQTNGIHKIALKYPADEIIKLWQVLLDIHRCKSVAILPFFKTEKEVENLLGELFCASENAGVSLPDREHRYYELSSDYQPILCLLMHATYKLNHTFTRIKLEPYSALLKQSFSAFQGIENVADISGNITKKKDAGIMLLGEIKSSKYAKNTLKILAKIKDYRIKA
jgi:hypothetical protein